MYSLQYGSPYSKRRNEQSAYKSDKTTRKATSKTPKSKTVAQKRRFTAWVPPPSSTNTREPLASTSSSGDLCLLGDDVPPSYERVSIFF
jgi:hypothetical protein